MGITATDMLTLSMLHSTNATAGFVMVMRGGGEGWDVPMTVGQVVKDRPDHSRQHPWQLANQVHWTVLAVKTRNTVQLPDV
jgi:hypothetical protein